MCFNGLEGKIEAGNHSFYHEINGFPNVVFCKDLLGTRSILDGYFDPLVFWYQWEFLLTSKKKMQGI